MAAEKQEHIHLYLTEVQAFASHLALDAGSRLRIHFNSNEKIQELSKGGVDFATRADEEIDRYIADRLKNQFPTTQVLTEESAPSDYSRLRDAENLWIVDPIDGTTNFSRKRPHFGISIALVSKGLPRVAVVYLPMQDELFTATESMPTLLNGEEIHVSETNTLQKAWIESGISWDMEKRREFSRKWFPILSQNVRAFTMSGSAVFDMAAVAKGQVDGFVSCGIKPWDQAATGLLIPQAGGKITTSEGKPWNTFEKDIVASNGILHNQLLGLIAA